MLGPRQSIMMNKENNPNLVAVDNAQNPQNLNKDQNSSKNYVLFCARQGWNCKNLLQEEIILIIPNEFQLLYYVRLEQLLI